MICQKSERGIRYYSLQICLSLNGHTKMTGLALFSAENLLKYKKIKIKNDIKAKRSKRVLTTDFSFPFGCT